ncbi:T9SS type A sorting domain-containing protein, partial [bacterium]|nr:T9SS type A sorting domain-containing protein [bacterium]
HNYNYTDTAVESGKVYTYMLADVNLGGVETSYDPVIVKVNGNMLTADFVLEAAYPNPFNPKTVISMSVFAKASPDKQNTVSSNIDLSIYNTNGEKVATLFSGEKTAGNYKVTWNAANMPSGIYIVRMHARNVVRSQKVVLIK